MMRTAVLTAALAAAVLWISPAGAQEGGWKALPSVSRSFQIENQTVEVRVELQLQIVVSGLAATLELSSTASLADLAAKVPPALRHLAARKSSCTSRWSFPAMAPPFVVDGRLKIAGQVRFESWTCGLVTTRLFRETADFVLAVWPSHAAERIVFQADLEKFDLGQSLLGDLGLEGEIRDALQAKLQDALAGDSAAIGFPPEVQPYGPEFTAVALVDNAGTPAMTIAAQATLTALQGAALLVELFGN